MDPAAEDPAQAIFKQLDALQGIDSGASEALGPPPIPPVTPPTAACPSSAILQQLDAISGSVIPPKSAAVPSVGVPKAPVVSNPASMSSGMQASLALGPGFASVDLVKSGVIPGHEFGESTYRLFEATKPDQKDQAPYLIVWLHGQDGSGEFTKIDIAKMQKRIGRRCFFLLPQSPKKSASYRYFFGLRATAAQNYNERHFIYGEIFEPYLAALCKVIMQFSQIVGAIANIAAGFSLGGFACWQLAGFRPDIFTAIIPVAGYVMGTLDTGGTYDAPQPESSHVFTTFCNQYAPLLKKVPVIIAIHAICDTVSSFRDTEALINSIRNIGGSPMLVSLDEAAANADIGKKGRRRGHDYFGHSLLNAGSEDVLYKKLRIFLDDAISRGLGTKGNGTSKPPQPKPSPTPPRAAFQVNSMAYEPDAPSAAKPAEVPKVPGAAPAKLPLSSWTLFPDVTKEAPPENPPARRAPSKSPPRKPAPPSPRKKPRGRSSSSSSSKKKKAVKKVKKASKKPVKKASKGKAAKTKTKKDVISSSSSSSSVSSSSGAVTVVPKKKARTQATQKTASTPSMKASAVDLDVVEVL